MDTEQRLRETILKELENINNVAFPKIYAKIQTKDGYLGVEKLIINSVIDDEISPSAAIAHLESELSEYEES